jgi:hypothetical protein
MEQIHETIDSARDYRGALMAGCLKRLWTALTHAAPANTNDRHEARNSLPRPASKTVSTGHR